MKHLLPKLTEAFPFVNKRPVTEEDLFAFCARWNIQIVFQPEITNGVWVRFQGDDYIFLNENLKGWRLLYVLAHEIAHCLFHAPSQSNMAVEFFDIHTVEKNHKEAEAVAAMLLLPISELERVLMTDLPYEIKELGILIALRLDLVSKYNIK